MLSGADSSIVQSISRQKVLQQLVSVFLVYIVYWTHRCCSVVMEECIIDNCSYLMFYIVRIVNQGTLWCRNISLETGHPWQPMDYIVVKLVVKFILKDMKYMYLIDE